MDLYIVTIEDNKVTSLAPFSGAVYTSVRVIAATLPEIKVMCSALGWTYEEFDDLINA